MTNGKPPEIALALVGKGRWGQNYIRTVRSLDNCHLPKKNIKTRDYRDLFKNPNIDGVIVATPVSTHFKIAKDFLEKDYNLLIEKPVTKTCQEALALQKIHNAHREVVVMAGHIQLYDPAYLELKRNLEMVGQIQKLSYKGLQSPVRQDASVLEDWGPHPIYLFIDLMAKGPVNISARYTSIDNVHLNLEFDNQISGIVDIGWTVPKRKRELSIIGTKGSITLDASFNTKRLFFVETSTNQEKDLDFPSSQSPLELEILEFVTCIKSGKKPKTPLEQGIQVIRILELAKESLA